MKNLEASATRSDKVGSTARSKIERIKAGVGMPSTISYAGSYTEVQRDHQRLYKYLDLFNNADRSLPTAAGTGADNKHNIKTTNVALKMLCAMHHVSVNVIGIGATINSYISQDGALRRQIFIELYGKLIRDRFSFSSLFAAQIMECLYLEYFFLIEFGDNQKKILFGSKRILLKIKLECDKFIILHNISFPRPDRIAAYTDSESDKAELAGFVSLVEYIYKLLADNKIVDYVPHQLDDTMRYYYISLIISFCDYHILIY